MIDHRKCGAPSGSVLSSRPRQRSRPSSDREEFFQRMEGADVIVLVPSVVVHRLLPKPRQTIHEPRRLNCEEHTADINRRGALSEDVLRIVTLKSWNQQNSGKITGTKRGYTLSITEDALCDVVWMLGRALNLTRKHLAVAPCTRLTQFLYH